MILRWLLVALVASTASAQPPFPWWENPIGNGLMLSDAQRTLVMQIQSEYRDRLSVELREVERAEREFEAVVNADTIDEKRGRLAINQLEKARGVFTRDLSQMILRMRAVLTAEQWRSLQIRRGGRDGGREGKGPRPEGRGRKGGPPIGSQPWAPPAR